MFICKECLDEFAPGAFENGIFYSHGACEDCHKTTKCRDIKSGILARWARENNSGGDFWSTTEKVKVESTKYIIKGDGVYATTELQGKPVQACVIKFGVPDKNGNVYTKDYFIKMKELVEKIDD